MELAEKLKYHRMKQGLSQENVAELLNLSRQAISKWENGHTAPDIDNLVLLSNIYKVSIDELLQENQQLQEAIQENNKDLATIVKEEKKLSTMKKKLPTGPLESGFFLLLLAIISTVIFPMGFLLIPFVLWQNNRSNFFYKFIYVVCIFSILLNLHTTYAHLSALFNWGITTVEQIE